MRKQIMKLKRFTLVELLVVISIIAILAGILMPQLGKAQESANRTANNSAVRSITQAAAGGMAMNRGSTIKGDWAIDFATISGNFTKGNGQEDAWTAADNIYIVPITDGSNAVGAAALNKDPVVNAEDMLQAAPAYPAGNEAFASMKSLRMNHGFDPDYGFYYYSGKRLQTGTTGAAAAAAVGAVVPTKKRNDTETRIVGEYYLDGNGDGFGAIGFSDTHVSMMKVRSGSGNLYSLDPDVLNSLGEPFGLEAVE